MADPVRGPLGRLSEGAARTLVAAGFWESFAVGLQLIEGGAMPPPADVDAAVAELKEKVLR